MASHSEHGTYLQFDPTRLDADAPVDPAHLRNNVINNLNHLLDEECQTVASLSLPSGDYYEIASPTLNVFQNMDRLPPMVFPLRVSPSGGSVKIVTLLRAYASGIASTVKFRIRLNLSGVAGYGNYFTPSTTPPRDSDPAVAEVSTSSTTPVNLTPATLQLTASQIGDVATRMRQGSRATTDGSGGSARAHTLPGMLEIWATTNKVGVSPRIVGFMAREYGG